MAANETGTVATLVDKNEKDILPEWLELQKRAGTLQTGRITETELVTQSREFLHLLREGLAKGGHDVANAAYTPVKDFLTNISRSRAQQGFSPTETATFVFSLKQPIFNAMNRDKTLSPADMARLTWAVTLLLVMKLLTESCKAQAQKALQTEGPGTMQFAFEVLGKVAGQELFSSPEVAGNLKGLAKYIDPEKIKALSVAPPKPQ